MGKRIQIRGGFSALNGVGPFLAIEDTKGESYAFYRDNSAENHRLELSGEQCEALAIACSSVPELQDAVIQLVGGIILIERGES